LRAGPLSSSDTIGILNRYFVPVTNSNSNYETDDGGPAPVAEKLARQRIYGKLHTERMLPADPAIRQTIDRILSLCPAGPPGSASLSKQLLLPRPGTRDT